MTCPICGGSMSVADGPHIHHLATIYNSRYFCPDGREHMWAPKRIWFRKRDVCTICFERRRMR